MFSVNVTFVFIIHSEVFRVKENVFKSNYNTAFFNTIQTYNVYYSNIICSSISILKCIIFLKKYFIINQKTLLIVGERRATLTDEFLKCSERRYGAIDRPPNNNLTTSGFCSQN